MKKYIFHLPIQEVWVISVEADSEEEAWQKLKDNRDSNQESSYGGNTKSGEAELMEIKDE